MEVEHLGSSLMAIVPFGDVAIYAKDELDWPTCLTLRCWPWQAWLSHTYEDLAAVDKLVRAALHARKLQSNAQDLFSAVCAMQPCLSACLHEAFGIQSECVTYMAPQCHSRVTMSRQTCQLHRSEVGQAHCHTVCQTSAQPTLSCALRMSYLYPSPLQSW